MPDPEPTVRRDGSRGWAVVTAGSVALAVSPTRATVSVVFVALGGDRVPLLAVAVVIVVGVAAVWMGRHPTRHDDGSIPARRRVPDTPPGGLSMSDDGDRVLTVIGAVIVLFIVAAVAALVIAAASGPGGDAPDADWDLERVNDTHVRIVHAGGEPIDADRLVVSVDGYERRVSWTGEVTEGDSGTVIAHEGTDVTLYWTRERRPRTQVASWSV